MTHLDISAQLQDLAMKVRHLCPSHRNPEAFHIQKSEIEAALRRLSRLAGGMNHKTATLLLELKS